MSIAAYSNSCLPASQVIFSKNPCDHGAVRFPAWRRPIWAARFYLSGEAVGIMLWCFLQVAGRVFFFEHVLTVPTGGISDFVLEPQLSGFFLFVWEWIGTPHSNTCKLPENFDWHGLPCPTTVKMRQILIMAGHRHPFEEGGITYTSHMFVPSPWSSVANGRPIQVGLDNLEHKAPDEVPLTGGFWTNVNQMRKRQTAHVAPIYIYLVTCHRW